MRDDLTARTEQYIRAQELIHSGDRVLLGLSGGADSVCLLLVLLELSETLSFSLGAFHVNHGIRGEEALLDEKFAEELCARKGVPFHVIHADVPALAQSLGIGLEEAGRAVRYREAERLCEEFGYTKLAVAHHRKDVSETFLFHLFRGSSLGGLASIPARRGNLIRPFLFCTREEIEAELLRRGEKFCIDSTNSDESYARNRIRNVILPAAEKINAGAEKHIAQAAAELSELSDYLTFEAEKICAAAKTTACGICIPVAEIRTLPQVLQTKVVHLLLTHVTESARDLTRTHLLQVLALCERQSGKQIDLPYDVKAYRSFDQLYLERKEDTGAADDPKTAEVLPEIPVTVPGNYVLSDGASVLSLRIFPYTENEQIPKNEYTKWFDYGKIKGTLKLRTKRDGDVLKMVQGSKSLKSIFNEKKIGTRQRNRMLLLTDEAQILWIPGVRACDNYRVDASTAMILEVQMNGGADHE